MRLGFIGLGSLGSPIAGRLVAAGHALFIHDIDPVKARGLIEHGAVACESVREVGDRADIVFLCLPAPEVSVQVASQLRATATCKVLVETSTVGRLALAQVQQAAGTGVELLDCPVSGGRQKALDGELTAIVAGPAHLVDMLRPVLTSFASRIFAVGDQAGLAQVCKIANNALSLTGLLIACEAVVMGVKTGLDAARMIEVINAGTGRNSATADKFPRAILTRTFDTGGAMTIGAKDLGLFLEEARQSGAPALATAVPAQLCQLALHKFGEHADMSMYIRMLEEWANLDQDGLPCQ